MAVRAMVSAFRRFSMNPSIKLKRILVVDHHVQINRMSKRVKQYQSRTQTKASTNVNFIADDEQTFASVFGVPKVSDVPSSGGESDEETESEEYQLPYTDHARS